MKIIILLYIKRRWSLCAAVSGPMWMEQVKRCRSKLDIKLSSEGNTSCRWPVRLTHLVTESNKHKCTDANAASTHQHVNTATQTRTRRPSVWAALRWRDALNTFSSIIFPLCGFQLTLSLPQHYIKFTETLPLVGFHWNSENRKCNSCRPTSEGLRMTGETSSGSKRGDDDDRDDSPSAEWPPHDLESDVDTTVWADVRL